MHRHPAGVAVAVVVVLAAIGLLIGGAQLWWVVVPPWTWWALRTDAQLADEWRAQERPLTAGGGEPPRGAFERAAARQQRRAEEENRLVGAEGSPDELLSPVTNRFLTVWVSWIAVLVVVGLLWAAGEAIVQALA